MKKNNVKKIKNMNKRVSKIKGLKNNENKYNRNTKF